MFKVFMVLIQINFFNFSKVYKNIIFFVNVCLVSKSFQDRLGF